MKTKSNSRSAFLIPRVVLGFALCSAGVLLALTALNKSGAETPVPKNVALQPGTWTATGSMRTARSFFTATLLTNGKVLVAGGTTNNGYTSAAELYDPATGLWTPTGSLTTRRTGHRATLLPDGKVLVAGGQDATGTSTSSAEVYDPSSGIWTPTGSMHTPRTSHTATLISTGPLSDMVLVMGGGSTCGACSPTLASAELYDPTTGAWTPTGSMNRTRYWDTSFPIVLADGSVLVVGGTKCCPYQWFNDAETYDPVTQTWTLTSMKMTHANDSPTLLPDGRVIVAGGIRGTQPTSVNVADSELFDSSTGIWTATASMSTDRAEHTLTLLNSDQVLVAGGFSGRWGVCNDLTSTELYDPSTGTWFPTAHMTASRSVFEAILLPSGQVLAMGGRNCALNVLSSAELYTPASRSTPTPTPTPTCTSPPPNMVSWWPGDGNANDIKDGNNGTLENGAMFAAGLVGQAFRLDGIDDFVNVGNAPNLHVSAGNFTVDAWVKFDVDGVVPQIDDMSIADKMSSAGLNQDGWRLIRQRDHGNFWFCLGGGPINGCDFNDDRTGGSATTVRSTTVAHKNVWYHVVGVLSSDQIAIYVNGVLEDEKARPLFTDTNSVDMLIGANALEGAHLNGLIDEVEIFNRALSASEIQAIFLAGSAGKCKPIPRPITVTFNTNPAGLSYRVDGSTYNSAQVFSWLSGSSHSISTTSPQKSGGHQYIWQSWSDDGAISHAIAPTTPTAYTAFFRRPTNIPTEGLVASYLFNGNTRDGTANHFDCTARNGAHLTTNRAGRANAAYAFDGVDDYIECPTDSRLGVHMGMDMTVSVWIRPAAWSSELGILSKYRHFQPQLSDFYIDIQNKTMVITAQGFDGLFAEAPRLGEWSHVAVVYRGTIGDATLYLNGNAIRTGPLTYNPVPGPEPLRIGTTVGADPDGFGSFNGSIDDVRIYERALGANEVRSLYNEIPR